MRLIWVTPRSPLGPPDGARHATCSLLQHLSQLQVTIDLVCIVPNVQKVDAGEVIRQFQIASCTAISRSASWLRRVPSPWTPFTFRTFAAPTVQMAFRDHIAGLLSSRDRSQKVFIVFDGLHPFAALGKNHLKALSEQCSGMVYRAHNVETVFWEQNATQSRTPWFRWFFRYQASLVKSLEQRLSQEVVLIAPVSEEDAAKFKEFAPKTAISVTPIGMDFPEEKDLPPVNNSEKLDLLFVGRLDWLPNRKGLQWFLETVWPRLIGKRTPVALQIAGVGDGRWLHRYQSLPGILFLGKVDELKPLYEACTLSIAPLFQGSGTRVKIIEAAKYGRAVMTTALGAEGTGLEPGKGYLRSETENEWVTQLTTLKREDCQKIGLMAYQRLCDRFDGKIVAERFVRTLEGVQL